MEQLEHLSKLNGELVANLGNTVTNLNAEAVELDNAIAILKT